MLSRVRKWEKKELGKGGFGPAGRQYVFSRLGLPISGAALVELCDAFGEKSVLRIPQKTDLPELRVISDEQ